MTADEREGAPKRARSGDRQALGELLESLRAYIRVLVRAFQDDRLRARVDESDLIQDAFVEVQRGFAGFRGTTVAQLVAWLRQVVIRTTGHTIRSHLDTGKRDVGREQLTEDLAALAAESGTSPSGQAIRHEQAALMAEALARLPEEMQQVLLSRHMDDLPHAMIAQQLGRSEGAVRVLYTRALRRLREALRSTG